MVATAALHQNRGEALQSPICDQYGVNQSLQGELPLSLLNSHLIAYPPSGKV